jgi:hypothetical protein
MKLIDSVKNYNTTTFEPNLTLTIAFDAIEMYDLEKILGNDEAKMVLGTELLDMIKGSVK